MLTVLDNEHCYLIHDTKQKGTMRQKGLYAGTHTPLIK